MSATPIIDAAIRAGCGMDACLWPSNGCNENGCTLGTAALVIAALRAALPWEPPAETIEAMAEGFANGAAIYEDDRTAIADAYNAHPIMRELYDENGVPRVAA